MRGRQNRWHNIWWRGPVVRHHFWSEREREGKRASSILASPYLLARYWIVSRGGATNADIDTGTFPKKNKFALPPPPHLPVDFSIFLSEKKRGERVSMGLRTSWNTLHQSPPPHRLRGPNNSHGHTEKIRPTDTLTFRGASHWISSFSTVCHRMSVSRKKIYGCGTRPLWNPDKQECRTGTSRWI